MFFDFYVLADSTDLRMLFFCALFPFPLPRDGIQTEPFLPRRSRGSVSVEVYVSVSRFSAHFLHEIQRNNVQDDGIEFGAPIYDAIDNVKELCFVESRNDLDFVFETICVRPL